MEATDRADELFNPYAPPESDLWAPRAAAPENAGDGLWRAGNLLVMSKAAWLPDRCIRCNREPSVRLDCSLRWHRPLVYLAILIHLLLYLVIMLFAVKTARIRVPLCTAHNRARWARIAAGVGLILLAFLLFQQALSAPPQTDPLSPDPEVAYLLALSPLLFLLGFLVILIGRHPIPAKKIDDQHVWLKKVSPEILAELPDAPYELRLR